MAGEGDVWLLEEGCLEGVVGLEVHAECWDWSGNGADCDESSSKLGLVKLRECIGWCERASEVV